MNVALISTISSAKQTSLETAEIAFQSEALLGNQGVVKTNGPVLLVE